MKYIITKFLIFLSSFISIFYISCNSNHNDSASFEIKEGRYYSTLKLTDDDFSGQSLTYVIDTAKWNWRWNGAIISSISETDWNVKYADTINNISKTEMDELFLNCTSLSKKLFRNPKELIFLESYDYDGIHWTTGFDRLSDTEGLIFRNGKNLLLIIKGKPIKNISPKSRQYGDGSTWLINIYIEGTKIFEPEFIDIRDDAGA